VLYYRHPSSLEHDPAPLVTDHPDRPERIAALEAAIEQTGWSSWRKREAPAAEEVELTLVHSAAHVACIRETSEAGGGLLDADTFVTETSYRAARHAAGGACAMVRALLHGQDRAGFCGARPSGHHAEYDRAMGFCLFNNVAVAAQVAIAECGVKRVMILDWDVHHGNGTAEIFRYRRDVLFASIHQARLFPATGPAGDAGSGEGLGYTINAPVPKGSDEEVWLSVLEHLIVPAGIEFAPELVLISAGFDAHQDDPIGGCYLDAQSYAQMGCHVRELGERVGAPVGAVLEGGYNPEALAASVISTLGALDGDGRAESIAPDPVVTPRLAAHVGHFWTL
jgi:acetoin utilization deacetylase AcuC-like enzyme